MNESLWERITDARHSPGGIHLMHLNSLSVVLCTCKLFQQKLTMIIRKSYLVFRKPACQPSLFFFFRIPLPCIQAQCSSVHGVISWKSRTLIKLNSEHDNATLANMTFQKKRVDSLLRLTWSSDTTQRNNHKCSKWFFKINDEECSDPGPVDSINLYGLHYVARGRLIIHRHTTMVGVCRGTKAGRLVASNYTITINVTPQCKSYPGGDAYSGWQSTSTLMVEELCPPQPWSFSWLQSTQTQTCFVHYTTEYSFLSRLSYLKINSFFFSSTELVSSNSRFTCTAHVMSQHRTFCLLAAAFNTYMCGKRPFNSYALLNWSSLFSSFVVVIVVLTAQLSMSRNPVSSLTYSWCPCKLFFCGIIPSSDQRLSHRKIMWKFIKAILACFKSYHNLLFLSWLPTDDGVEHRNVLKSKLLPLPPDLSSDQ